MRTVTINEEDRIGMLDFLTKAISENYNWIVYNDTKNGQIVADDLVSSVRLQDAQYVCERRNEAENMKYQYPEIQYKYMPSITMAKLLNPGIDLSQFQNSNLEDDEKYSKVELSLQRRAAEKMDENSQYIITTNNSKIMNEKNLESLKKQVMYTGFGNLLDYQIAENMKKELPAFQLNHKPEFGKDQAEATLNFRKSEQGNYFFNTYDLLLNKEGEAPLKQTFHVHKPDQLVQKVEGAEDKIEWVNSTITLKEAYNMMEGRSVLKDYVSQENVKYSNWNTLDFKNTDQNGNFKIKRTPDFNLESKLSALPIKELVNEDSKNSLLDSLRKGNRQSVTIESDGAEHKMAIEACPQFKTINRFESNVKQSVSQKETNDQSTKQDQKQGQEKEKGEDGNRKSQNRSSRKRQGYSQ